MSLQDKWVPLDLALCEQSPRNKTTYIATNQRSGRGGMKERFNCLKTEPSLPEKKNQNKKMESTMWAAPIAFWLQH
jgi:hypothetical protein